MTARVLVVDDIIANVRLLEAKLSAEYFEVITAMNGLDALDAVQKSRPDIILLDIMMPGIDGIETCRRLRTTHGYGPTIVMLTASESDDIEAQAMKAGADRFLTKPFSPIELLQLVDELGVPQPPDEAA